jgi:hypothetical protein
MGSFVRLIAVATALVLAFGVAGALAEPSEAPLEGQTMLPSEEPNRAEYVSELEKICKPGSDETQKAMRHVRRDVNEGRLAVATYKFRQATKIFGRTIRKIAKKPRPSADTERLKKWFMYLNQQEKYLKGATAQLAARHTHKAQRLTARFIHSGNLGNGEVLPFGFNYCSFKFSRYGF